MEKFAFEELSINPKANLAETDMEKLFGFKNNKAMNFIGRGFGESLYSTLANIPKEKRAVIYTAINAFTVSAKNAQEAREKMIGGGSATWLMPDITPTVIARLLKNFDKAESMYNAGKLTAKNIIKEFFSEIPDKGDYNCETINNYFNDIAIQLSLDEDDGGQYTDVASAVSLTMENSGATFEEVVQALREKQVLQQPKYFSSGSMPLEKMDGTTSGGRKLIGDDLYRPDFCYRFTNDLSVPLLDANGNGFGFTFPGADKFYTNGTQQGRENVQLVGDKVVELCGAVHVNQANSVMMMLGQSGLAILRGGLGPVNCTSNEHAPVDYTLTKNEQTGDVTIKYTSPEALPFSFEWTSTIDVNGNVTSTPMIFKKKTLSQDLVSSTLDNAVSRMNVNLSEEQKTKAAQYIGELGRAYQLEGTKLDFLANFVVRLGLTQNSAASDLKYATDMAKNISHWTEFQVGQGENVGVGKLETTIKNLFNELIDDAMADAAKGAQSSKYVSDPDVSSSMITDANRNTFIFNGEEMKKSVGEVIAGFKRVVQKPAMRQGLSSILHQISPLVFSSLSMRGDMFSTTAHPKLSSNSIDGIEKIVSRDMDKGDYQMGTFLQSDDVSLNLDVKEDGTATFTVKARNSLATGAGNDPMSSYGSVDYSLVLQIDLTGAKPVITDAKLGQSFDLQ
ncbi:MAG: hypothetical protein IJS50_00315 [Desulfovibrio sp.]|nr:hypothetical protein [Desulfovibrio sp.]